MWKKNLRRFIGKLLISLLTIFLVATFNFFLIRFMPGDPLEHLVGEEDYLYLTSAHPEVLEELEVEYGLDGTLWEQYTSYLGRLLHGDLGHSYKNKVAVLTLILQRLGRTFRLILPAIVLSSLIGIFLGAVAGWREGSRLDRVISRASLIIYSVPGYCLGMLLLSGRRPLRRDVQRRPDRSGLCKRCAVAHGAARRNPDTEQVSICHFDDAQQCPG